MCIYAVFLFFSFPQASHYSLFNVAKNKNSILMAYMRRKHEVLVGELFLFKERGK
jgi:hypothetical protein